jgi:hypothetical protein
MTTPTRRALALAAGVLALVLPATAAHSLWSTQATATFTVTVAAAPTTPPPPTAPADFRCTNVNPAQISLAWSASAGAASYRIYRSGTNLFVEVAAPATSLAALHRNTWAIGTSEPATLVVRAVSSTGQMSPASNPVSLNFGNTPSCNPRSSS